MRTSLKDLYLAPQIRQAVANADDPTFYLDLKQSSVEPLIMDADIIDGNSFEKDGRDFPPFYKGSILKLNFRLVFKNLPPAGSSVILFSSHRTNEPFRRDQKEAASILSKAGNLFWYLVTLKWLAGKNLEYDLLRRQTKNLQEYNASAGSFQSAEPKSFQPALDDGQDLRNLGIGKKVIKEGFEQNYYEIFLTDNDATSYEVSMNLDSRSFNIANHSSEAVWISLKHTDSCCHPLALCLPRMCLEIMVYLIATPAYLSIALDGKKEVSEIMEFHRSDGAPVKICPDLKKKYPFLAVETLRDNAVQITINLDFIKASNEFTPGKNMRYLKFLDESSNNRLGISMPVIIVKTT